MFDVLVNVLDWRGENFVLQWLYDSSPLWPLLALCIGMPAAEALNLKYAKTFSRLFLPRQVMKNINTAASPSCKKMVRAIPLPSWRQKRCWLQIGDPKLDRFRNGAEQTI
jgi:hypothetical protein